MSQRNVNIVQGQTIFDIVSQEYGDMNYLNDFLDLNGFHINHNLLPGNIVIVDTDNVGNKKNKDYFSRIGIQGKRIHTSVNYIEYSASDYSAAHYNSNDYS